MFSATYKKRLATAMAGAALASALAVSGASAVPAERILPRTAGDSHEVPPPPSSIAVSAAEEYKDLRSPDAVDAARAAGDAPDATPPSGSDPVAEGYQDLRAPDTRDAAEGYSPTLESQPVADGPSEPAGFDLVSAAIGAVAAGALSLVLMASLGLRRPPRQRPASA
jgi:hypothetical protein